jgi:DNA-binding transcriptional regulator YdaS (Cro superfamily)
MNPIRSKRGLMAKVARDLGISRSAVSLWKRVPAEYVVAVEDSTNIPREVLRPDLYQHRNAA